MPTYRVTGGPDGTAGINYKDKRVEPGDDVSDLPRESIKWLKEQGYIAAAGDKPETIDAGTDEGDSAPTEPEVIA